MKKSYSNISFFIALFILLLSYSSNAQIVYNEYGSKSILKHWYGQVSVGGNAFFGDISTYDLDPVNKLKHETSFSYSASFGKWVNHWGAVQFTFSNGELRGVKNNYSSKAYIYQYALEGIIDVTQLIHRQEIQSHLLGYIKFGYGYVEINSYLTDNNTGEIIGSQGIKTAHGKRVTEWVIPFGIGGVYNIDENYGLFLDALYEYVDSDKLDAKYNTGTVDHYMNISFGFRYTFNIKNKQANYRKNSSRKRIHWVK